jgi:hypothetical protein
LINPIVNPADILPVNGIPKLVIVTEAAAAWLLSLIAGICMITFASVVIAPSDTVWSLFQFMLAIWWYCRYANPAKIPFELPFDNIIPFP